MSGREVEREIRSPVNIGSIQLERPRILHEEVLVPVLTYRNETMIWREKKRSKI